MIRDEDAAKKVLKNINKESRELLVRLSFLHKEIHELQRFLRRDAQAVSNYTDGQNLRTSASELLFITRHLPKTISELKKLANYAYPYVPVPEESDEEDDEDSPNKIDKNVKVPKINREPESESVEESDS